MPNMQEWKTGTIPPFVTLTMGILADSLQATLDAMKEQDRISQQKTKELLERMNTLIEDLKNIDLED